MLQSRIRRGQLDREITFITPELEESESNEDKIDSWIQVDDDPTVYAMREDMPGNEEPVADRVTPMQRTKFTTDYRDDITARERIVCETKVFEIISVGELQSGRERYIEILTNKIANELWT
jgi:SPP1 family predicted phage head-tail adaptor